MESKPILPGGEGDNTATISTESHGAVLAGAGATIATVYMGREMNCYAVHEPELDALSSLSDDANRDQAIAGAMLGVFVTLGWDLITSSDPMVTRVGAGLMFLSGVGGAFFLKLAFDAKAKRKSMLDRIKKDAIVIARR